MRITDQDAGMNFREFVQLAEGLDKSGLIIAVTPRSDPNAVGIEIMFPENEFPKGLFEAVEVDF